MENIKNGDEVAFKELLDKHHNMIYKIIYGLNIEHGDFQVDVDSLYQEGSLALYDAVFSYKQDSGMTFSSYAYMVIQSRLRTYLRDHCRYLEKENLSIDIENGVDYEIFAKPSYVCEDPVTYYHSRQFEESLNNFLNKLTKQDQDILKLRGENCTYEDISNRLNIKRKRVDNRLEKLRKELRGYLQENN